jgi:hypothetical protein
MRILTAILATVTVIVAAQSGSATVQEAQQLAQYAWDAISAQEWDTASQLLEQAIAASPDTCMDRYYQQMQNITLEAETLKQQGWSGQQVYGWYEQQVQNVYEDCVE